MEKWLQPETITLWIAIVIAVIALLVISFVKLAHINVKRSMESQLKESKLKLDYQNKLLEAGILAQEQERARIAADLHDSLIGKLTLLRLQHGMQQGAGAIDTLIGESIDEARRISHDLSVPLPEMMSVDELIGEMAASWRKTMAINLYNDIRCNPILPDTAKIQLTRIVQELIINIYKHAPNAATSINLRISQKWLAIVVRDSGPGFKAGSNRNGIGLKNIELRMLYLGGKHKLKTGPWGTSILLVAGIDKISKL